MGKILVIGSAVADVVITLPHLPSRSEDVHVRTQHMNLGGCGMNTFDMMRHLEADAIPFFPVGRGAYGEFVRSELKKRGIVSPVPDPEEENGCCYCFIEDDGERTFLSYHGAEYRFRKEWFDLIDPAGIGYVYFCGLEIEEDTGIHIVDFLEQLRSAVPDICLFFAPGPRITRISQELFLRILRLRPVLHLNLDEALAALKICDNGIAAAVTPADTDPLTAARLLSHNANAPAIITLGEAGCCFYDARNREHAMIPAVPTRQVDTNGAGDAHIGAVIAALQAGYSLPDALRLANEISSLVVSTPGATLPDDIFREKGITLEHHP